MSISNSILYGLLFLTLTPGFIITMYPGNKGFFFSSETNYYSIILHTLLLAYIIVSFQKSSTGSWDDRLKIEDKDIMPINAIILFVLLTPGLLLTLPSKDGEFFLSGNTNRIAIVVHTIIFIIMFTLLVNLLSNKKNNTK
jgi:hypothetical protein